MDAGAPTLRSRDDVASDILCELGKLKPSSRDARAAILRSVDQTSDWMATWVPQFKAKSVSATRKKATRAERALALLEGFPAEVTYPLKRYAVLARVTGPDKRFDLSQWLCAFQACLLVEKFSSRPPVSTPNGNVHNVAIIIFEAVTGKPASDAGLLKACRKVLRFRKAE